MAKGLTPVDEERAFLGPTREAIDQEIRRGSDASAGSDDHSMRMLREILEDRLDAFRSAREKPFDGAFEWLVDGEYLILHYGKQHIDVGEDLVLDFRAPLAAARFSNDVTERRVIRYKEDEIDDVLVEGVRRGSGLRSLLDPSQRASQPAISRSRLVSSVLPAVNQLVTINENRVKRMSQQSAILPKVERTYSTFIDAALQSMLQTRGSKMADIVGTIQGDQDALMRLPKDVATSIEGGPGTGKTVVGLHRLAFVAYEARNQNVSGRLLMLGPSDRFVQYVKNVLPSLGERRVEQKSFSELCLVSSVIKGSATTIDIAETAESALLKSSPLIFGVMRRVLVGRLRSRTVRLRLGTYDVSIEAATIRERLKEAAVRLASGAASMASIREELAGWMRYYARTTATFGDRNARDEITRRVLEEEKAAERAGKPFDLVVARERSFDEGSVERAAKEAALRLVPDDDPVLLLAQFHDARSDVFQTSDEAFAPTPLAQLVRRLILLGVSAEQVKRRRSGALSPSDLPILHELSLAITGNSPQPFDHVMIDEAQDFTPAMLHVARRYFSGESVTLLGDFNQRTRPEAATSWGEIKQLLNLGALTVAGLNKSYRVPKQILEFSARVLSSDDRKRTPEGVRSGSKPEIVRAKSGKLQETVGRLIKKSKEGQVLVIADAHTRKQLFTEDERVSIIDPREANGLEAGFVIIVEPGHWQADASVLPHVLYVALTRAMGRLAIVHSDKLPEGLAGKPVVKGREGAKRKKRRKSVAKKSSKKRAPRPNRRRRGKIFRRVAKKRK